MGAPHHSIMRRINNINRVLCKITVALVFDGRFVAVFFDKDMERFIFERKQFVYIWYKIYENL